MKRSSLVPALLCIGALGCSDTGTDAASPKPNGAEAQVKPAKVAAETLVSGFADPDLAGMTVRDHASGAQIVTPPSARKAERSPVDGPSKLDMLAPRAVLTAVNETPVRNAAHFRDLMNEAHKKGEEIKLGQQLFMVDENNDGWVTLSASEPENQTSPAR